MVAVLTRLNSPSARRAWSQSSLFSRRTGSLPGGLPSWEAGVTAGCFELGGMMLFDVAAGAMLPGRLIPGLASDTTSAVEGLLMNIAWTVSRR